MEDVSAVGVGVEGKTVPPRPRVLGIALRRGPGRVGMAEDVLAHPVPDVAEVLVPAGGGRLAARTLMEVVSRVLEEGVLVADDFLEGGAVRDRAGSILGFSPGDVVEVVVLEGAVQVVRVTKARVIPVGVAPVAVAERVIREVVEDIRRAALPGLDAAVIVAVE